MTVDDVPRVSRRRRSRRKKRNARKARRYTKVIGWSLVAFVMTALFVTGVIYIVLSMRGDGSGIPTPTVQPQ